MLWDYMGAAPGYETFTGAVEMLAGVLLLVPQTPTLGALIALGALANVFLLIYSTYTRRAQYLSKVPFWGTWTVDEFVLDGAARQPLTSDERRWPASRSMPPHIASTSTAPRSHRIHSAWRPICRDLWPQMESGFRV